MNEVEDKTQKPCGKATSSASKQRMHTAYTRRSRCRGTYYKDYVLAYVYGFAERTGCSFSHAVNCLLEKVLSEGLKEVEEKLGLEVKREQLLEEERNLRERLRVILRSGTYIKDYLKNLLFGDVEEISRLKRREGVYARLTPKELNIILRLLKRREDLVAELLEIEDKLLPSEAYSLVLTEQGWKIEELQIARGKFRRLNQTRPAEEPRQHAGGENRNE